MDVVTRLLPKSVQSELDALHPQLQAFSGHRAVWLDGDGQLWHAEPDEMLEDLGHIYVGTFFRPSLEDLSIAVARVCPRPRRVPDCVAPQPAPAESAPAVATA